MKTKTVTLHFEVPADLDTPSEVLAKMKQLLLAGLGDRLDNQPLDAEEQRLCDALRNPDPPPRT